MYMYGAIEIRITVAAQLYCWNYAVGKRGKKIFFESICLWSLTGKSRDAIVNDEDGIKPNKTRLSSQYLASCPDPDSSLYLAGAPGIARDNLL